jgi:hypothetical protein
MSKHWTLTRQGMGPAFSTVSASEETGSEGRFRPAGGS